MSSTSTETPPPPPAPLPGWVWVFVALNAVPLLMGGALGGAFAGLGTAGCLLLARQPTLPLFARLAACLSLTLLCWLLWIAVAMWALQAFRPAA